MSTVTMEGVARYELHNVKRHYDPSMSTQRAAVAIDRLIIPLGGVIAIVGASGSGKTTLLNLLGGLEAADVGNHVQPASMKLYLPYVSDAIELCQSGSDTSLLRPRGRFPYKKASYIFQQGYLLNQASIAINLSMTRRAAGLSADSDALLRLLDFAQLTQEASQGVQATRLQDRAVTLSGGQQQRINIARAVGRDPVLLFADELSSSLDPGKADAVMRELRQWIWGKLQAGVNDRRQLSRTLMWVTHDYPLACRFADAVIVLSEGRLAHGCNQPVEISRLTEPLHANVLQSWIAKGSVPDGIALHGEVTPRLFQATPENSEVQRRKRAGQPLNRFQAAIGNAGAGLVLSWMEAFPPIVSTGNKWPMLRNWLRPLFGFTHWVKALQLGAVLALIMIIIYGQESVIGYFDQQLADPSLRHVIVQQNSRDLQRSIIDDDSLAELSKDIVANDLRVAFGRFTESVDAYPVGEDQINSGFVAEISLGVIDREEPVYREMMVYPIGPEYAQCVSAQSVKPADLISYADELLLIVSKRYLDDTARMFSRSLCLDPRLDLWDAGAPRTFRVVGYVDAPPADGFDNFDAIIQSDVWRTWTSLVGKSQLSTFSRASVYFTQFNHAKVIELLQLRAFAFDQEIVNKFQRLIGTAAQLRNTFLAITWLSLAVACTVAAGLIWSYLVQNAKSIAVLRAHDAWFWPLMTAIPFQLFITFIYALLYISLCILFWNAIASVDMFKSYLARLSEESWQVAPLGWNTVEPALPWLAGSLLVVMVVGWLCLWVWHLTHRRLAHELRQAY